MGSHDGLAPSIRATCISCMAPNKNTFSGSDIRWKALPPLPDERQTQSSHKSKKDTRDRSRSSFIQREEGSSTKAKETKYRCSQHSSSTSSKPNSATFHSVPQSVSQPISIGRSSTHLYLPSPLRPGHRSHSSWEPPRSATPDRSPVSPTMTRSVSKPNLSTSYQSPVSPYYDTASQDARSRASQTHSRQSNSSWAAYRPVGSGSPDGSAFSDPSQYHLFVEATSGLSPVAQTHAQAPSSLRSPSSSVNQCAACRYIAGLVYRR
ncbi:hypothetical protein M501DRAFT_507804 [Patellaria atrata CBS 101060]|uniref:Uncharacterized protein n=1 Tax=Patellaria atrata CBS 101060 TaxID=1346257 RepID=A0A9P4VNQ7_9PEZI|nr:hypothetical protein M501DRAFT_507804 [Patellaria atrata CBS 101060]